MRKRSGLRTRPASAYARVALLLFSAACAGKDGPVITQGGDGSVSADGSGAGDAGLCATECPPCAVGTACVRGGILSSYGAACLRSCASSSECGNGERCAVLFNQAAAGPVCVAATTPALCPGVTVPPNWHCDLQSAYCRDGRTLMVPFSQVSNMACGWELQVCPQACSSVDAGAGPTGTCN